MTHSSPTGYLMPLILMLITTGELLVLFPVAPNDITLQWLAITLVHTKMHLIMVSL